MANEITSRQGELLAEALGKCLVASGIVRPDAAMTGPHLLLFADDLEQMLKEQNTRPAAPVEGLETVEYQVYDVYGRWQSVRKFVYDLNTDQKRDCRELVTRSQAEAIIGSLIPRANNCGRYLAECNDGRLLYLNHANTWQECPNFIETKNNLIKSLIDFDSDEVKRLEAIIAAKDETLQDAIDCVKVLTDEKNMLEADNAALTARVKELEDIQLDAADVEPGEHQEILDALEAHNSGE